MICSPCLCTGADSTYGIDSRHGIDSSPGIDSTLESIPCDSDSGSFSMIPVKIPVPEKNGIITPLVQIWCRFKKCSILMLWIDLAKPLNNFTATGAAAQSPPPEASRPSATPSEARRLQLRRQHPLPEQLPNAQEATDRHSGCCSFVSAPSHTTSDPTIATVNLKYALGLEQINVHGKQTFFCLVAKCSYSCLWIRRQNNR